MYELILSYPVAFKVFIGLVIGVACLGFFLNTRQTPPEKVEDAPVDDVSDATGLIVEPPAEEDPDPELAPGLRESDAEAYAAEFLKNPGEDYTLDLRHVMGDAVSTLKQYIEISQQYLPFVHYFESLVAAGGYLKHHEVDLENLAKAKLRELPLVWTGEVEPEQSSRPLDLPIGAGRDGDRWAHKGVRITDGLWRGGWEVPQRSFFSLESAERFGLAEGRIVLVKATVKVPTVKITYKAPQLVLEREEEYDMAVSKINYDRVSFTATRDGDRFSFKIEKGLTGGTYWVDDFSKSGFGLDNRVTELFVPNAKPVATVSASHVLTVKQLTQSVFKDIQEKTENKPTLWVYRAAGFLNVQVISGSHSTLVSDREAYLFRNDHFEDVLRDGNTLAEQLVVMHEPVEVGNRLEIDTEDSRTVWYYSNRLPIQVDI